MVQETSVEFGARLRQAVEGHPLAPPPPFGRQKWLQEKLQREAQLEVSPNAVHKWMRGASRPREDSIRKIAKVLAVDDVWLARGRRPVIDPAVAKVEAVRGHGATLILAGLIEMEGGRVAFPADAGDTASLWADLGGGRKGIIVVPGRVQGAAVSYIVPEPVGSNRVIAVNVRQAGADERRIGTFELIDLTPAPRKNFGVFSVVQAEAKKDGCLKVEGLKDLLVPIHDFEMPA